MCFVLVYEQTLKAMLDNVSEYVDKVVKGEEEPNSAIGKSEIQTYGGIDTDERGQT